MKKLEELLAKRNAELEGEKKALQRRKEELNERINESNRNKILTLLKFVPTFTIAVISFRAGFFHEDGSLLTGLIQLLAYASIIASIFFLVQLIIITSKHPKDES